MSFEIDGCLIPRGLASFTVIFVQHFKVIERRIVAVNHPDSPAVGKFGIPINLAPAINPDHRDIVRFKHAQVIVDASLKFYAVAVFGIRERLTWGVIKSATNNTYRPAP